jgi:hypothetical protein
VSKEIKKNQMKWRKVSELGAGMKIAVPKARALAVHGGVSASDDSLEIDDNSGDIAWDEIVDIRRVGSERVYDIEVEGTHNFVAGHLIDQESGEKLSEREEKNFLQDIKNNLRAKSKVFFGGIFAHNTSVVPFGINSNRTGTDNVLEIKSDNPAEDNMIFRIQADGEVFADGAYSGPGADYAEYFYTDDTDLVPGEAVCVDVTKTNAIKRCDRSGDNNIMGVVSSNPSIIGNSAVGREKDSHYKVIALLGQISAKVSTENGPIQIGDSLTGSSVAGYLRKANAGESTVGIAMQKSSGSAKELQILISRRNQSLTVEKVEEAVMQNIATMNIQDQVDQMIASAQTKLAELASFTTQVALDLDNLELKTAEETATLESQVNENIAIVGNRFEGIENIIANLGNGETGSLVENALAQLKMQTNSFENRLSLVEGSLGGFASNDEFQKLTMTTENLSVITESLSSQLKIQMEKVNFLAKKVASIDGISTSEPVEEVWYEFVAGEDEEISTDLAEMEIGDGVASGIYNGESDDREFVIQKTKGADLSGYEANEGELVFDFFVENAALIEDFKTEFGNESKDARIEWSLVAHPLFTDGWNEVRLPLSGKVSVEDIDWSDTDFFRIYLRLSSESGVEFKNIRFEAKELRNVAQLESENDILDAKLNLLLDTDQKEAITIIANTVNNLQSQVNIESNNTKLKLSGVETAINDLTAFDNLVVDQLSLHEQRISALESAVGITNMVNSDKFAVDAKGNVVFEGTVTAKEIKTKTVVAGEYTVTNENEIGNSKNTGSTVIQKGETEIFVENSKIKSNSRIIVTPIGDNPIDWIISDKRAEEGFVIKLKETAEFDVTFDYWIVQTE